jgi:hypothetical protein
VRVLTTEFGAPTRSQASMSRYLSGKQRMPVDLLPAVTEYIRIFGNPESVGGDSHGDRPGAVGDDSPVGFDSFVQRLTDEPLLGPRQGAVVDAFVGRLREGPPLSDQDHAALTDIMRILGLRA